jgi:hypothetical protein
MTVKSIWLIVTLETFLYFKISNVCIPSITNIILDLCVFLISFINFYVIFWNFLKLCGLLSIWSFIFINCLFEFLSIICSESYCIRKKNTFFFSLTLSGLNTEYACSPKCVRDTSHTPSNLVVDTNGVSHNWAQFWQYQCGVRVRSYRWSALSLKATSSWDGSHKPSENSISYILRDPMTPSQGPVIC